MCSNLDIRLRCPADASAPRSLLVYLKHSILSELGRFDLGRQLPSVLHPDELRLLVHRLSEHMLVVHRLLVLHYSPVAVVHVGELLLGLLKLCVALEGSWLYLNYPALGVAAYVCQPCYIG